MTDAVTVAPQDLAEEGAVAAVVRSAFGAEGEVVARLWAELAAGAHLRASLVARTGGEPGGEVVGHVGLSRCWVDARERLVEAWLLSPLSVAPGRQRGGIGSALVAAALATARAAGSPMLLLEGSPDYYGARGFEVASPHGLAPASVRTPDRAFQVALLDAHEPWMTGRVVYPDVWWRHDAAGLRDPDLAALEELLGSSDPARRKPHTG